ncbi:MAG: enoyl-CoA hydratase/isomerase family protein [Ardenticatenales bacterium]|nr:enoyl-CoA hydratase/isomerase family protein [Ardenticatenales bacterium]
MNHDNYYGRSLVPRPADSFGFREVTYEKRDWIARITIDRPDRHNAYSTSALESLATAFRDASFDDSVAVIVFSGTGHRAFCTGGDVKEYQAEYTDRPRDYWKYMRLFRAYLESILNAGKPVIARLNGMAVGGGNESQMACDLAVMAEHAYLRQVGTSVGSVAAGGATQWLPIHIGDRRAREMLFLNEPIPAYQALDWGLVNQVVPSVIKDGAYIERAGPEAIELALGGRDGYSIDLTALDQAVDVLCQKLVDKFAECTRYTREQVGFWKQMSWSQTIGHAGEWLALHYTSLEPLEGMTAFVERRSPDYRAIRQRAADGGSSEFRWGPYSGRCSVCGTGQLPVTFRFCGQCGASLADQEARDVRPS